jgi:adenylylsulfate kinase
MHKESRLRSVLKGFSWRCIATVTIICIAYFKTGDVTLALEIGVIEFFVKFLFYYIHERAWAQIPRGFFRNIYLKYLKWG